MKILLGLDGSEAALEAVHQTLRLVHAGLKAQLVLANVQEPATLYEVITAHDAEVIKRVSQQAGAHALEPARQLLRAAGAEFETEIASGDAGHVLIDIAERFGCDLIVIGRRGGGASRGAFGSVANAVVHSAQVPVMIAGPADA
jgi:nucleotide-binding universal stress UspA family protein